MALGQRTTTTKLDFIEALHDESETIDCEIELLIEAEDCSFSHEFGTKHEVQDVAKTMNLLSYDVWDAEGETSFRPLTSAEYELIFEKAVEEVLASAA